MQRYLLFPIVCSLLLIHPLAAQRFDSLAELKDHTVKIYYSADHEQRAASIALRVDKAMDYYKQMLGLSPVVTLLVLTAEDWTKYSTIPAVYGMPHYNKDNTLFVAADDNPFWKSFLPPLVQLPPDIREQVITVYKGNDSSLSMQAFFDLLAIHELGHAFLLQGGLHLQRKWMGELFANILLHTYIAENEPASLPALTLFPRMVVGSGAREFIYTSLGDIEERYNEIGQHYPKNYGWYQCRWHIAAAGIYDSGGREASRRLWNALKNQEETLGDEELAAFLSASAHQSVADVMRNWDKDTVK